LKAAKKYAQPKTANPVQNGRTTGWPMSPPTGASRSMAKASVNTTLAHRALAKRSAAHPVATTAVTPIKPAKENRAPLIC
jgi:hypothetical protein